MQPHKEHIAFWLSKVNSALPMYRRVSTPVRVTGMFFLTSLGWDSGHVMSLAGNAHPIPTLLCNPLFGMSPDFFRTCSQVLTTRSENPLVRLILVAVTRSSVRRAFIIMCHLDLISLLLCIDSLMTRSHRSTQMRWAEANCPFLAGEPRVAA